MNEASALQSKKGCFSYLLLHPLRVREAGEKVGLKTENGGCVKEKKKNKQRMGFRDTVSTGH